MMIIDPFFLWGGKEYTKRRSDVKINQTSPPHIPYRIINVCIELICDLLCFIFNRTLNDSHVDSLGIRMLPNFADPYHHR